MGRNIVIEGDRSAGSGEVRHQRQVVLLLDLNLDILLLLDVTDGGYLFGSSGPLLLGRFQQVGN